MGKRILMVGGLLAVVGLILSGCVVRTYEATQKRVDQDLSDGNRGFIAGTAPEAEERKPTRKTRVTEFEFGYPFRFENRPPVDKSRDVRGERVTSAMVEDEGISYGEGNKGYLYSSDLPESAARDFPVTVEPASEMKLQEYTVQKGDTLQKISMKFYGTTKKWQKIFDANSDTLSSPDKIYPGQVIVIPVSGFSGKIK